MTRIIQKPAPSEYPAYSSIYMDLVPEDGLILEHLWNNFEDLKTLILDLPEERLLYRYAPDKWSIKEILVHLIDDERIFSYRAMRWARNDGTPLYGFDQDLYAKYSEADRRSVESIFDEYESVRKATITLYKYLPDNSLMRAGAGMETDGTILYRRTVRAMVYHIAGHELRHINIIKDRYLI